ncbi:unnamed protein product [Clonostachys rosea]|uniref:NACHT domain-containing protein n=1 Tax=Bionectria ochroleuca TaxID=29856 RepID=A0ABY6UQS4_BIOOC|nr:unnamed protein product [Clonostachys rosea]
MAQLIRPPSDNIRQMGLHSEIERLLSTAGNESLKSAFMRDVWSRLEGDYKLMVRHLIAHCENLVKERNISAIVDGRVKTEQSIYNTIDRRLQYRIDNHQGEYQSVEEMFNDMHDLAGIRIVVDYPSQLAPANQLIAEAFFQDKSPNGFKRDRPVGKAWDAWFGAYQSYNHHVSVKDGTEGTLQAYRNVVFEVQLTSLPESMYNKLAHPFLYKQQAGDLSRGDEMVIDLSHGLSLCYSICLLYAQDKLENNEQPDENLMSAMRSAVADAEDGQLEGMSPLLNMMPDMVKAQSAPGPRQEPDSKVSTELLTSTLSTLQEQCTPGQLWTGFVEKMKGWDARLEAVETAVKDQTSALQQRRQDDTDKKCLVDLRVINPSTQKKTIENAKGGLLKGAYKWILKHPEYQRFRNDNTNRLLWVKGDPGKGKTMLWCGIINDLEHQRFASVSYFFCEATQNNALRCATAVLRTLIWRLCTSQPHLVSYVRKKYDTEGKDAFEDSTALFTLEEIMADILQHPGCSEVTLVIDALDECTEDTMPDLIGLIIKFSNSYKAKWIVSSRNWPMIEEQFQLAEKVKVSLELNQDSVSDAVKFFINHKVDQLAMVKRYDATTKVGVLEALRHKANDTFLWVALVCAQLSKPDVRSWNAIQVLHSIPAGLEKLYGRMLRQVFLSINYPLYKQLLVTASIAACPLSFEELPIFIQELKNFSNEQIEEAIGECGSFLSARENHVHLVHQSAQDFLLGNQGRVLRSTIQGHHLQMFRKSMTAMEILKRNMFGVSSPGKLLNEIPRTEINPFPAIRYCCLHWVHHLKLADHERQAQDVWLACEFFKTKVLYWVEALSFHGYTTEGISAGRKLGAITYSDELKDLSEDLYRFLLTFREVMYIAPLQLYCSALLFAPVSSLVKSLHETSRYQWVTLTENSSQGTLSKWDACILALEVKNVRSLALSADGQHLVYAHGDIGEPCDLTVWDVNSNTCKHSVAASRGIRTIAISSNGRHVAVVLTGDESRGVIELRDMDLSLSGTQLKKGNVTADSVVFSPDGRQIAAGLSTGAVCIWDLATGARRHKLSTKGTGAALSVAYSADSKRLAVARRYDIRVWDLASGKCLLTFAARPVGAVFLSGSKLATTMHDRIRICDTDKGSICRTWEEKNGDVSAIASLDLPGLLLASGSENGSLKIWDQTGNCLQALFGHRKSLISLSFSPEEGLIASASKDETIRLWDIRTVLKMSQASSQVTHNADPELESHSCPVRAVEFSPDSKWLASVATDDTINLWEIAGARMFTSKAFFNFADSWPYISGEDRWFPENYVNSHGLLATIREENMKQLDDYREKNISFDNFTMALPPWDRAFLRFKPSINPLMNSRIDNILRQFPFEVQTLTVSSDSCVLVLASRILACAYQISTGEVLWRIFFSEMENASIITLSRDSKQFGMLSDRGVYAWEVDTLPFKRLFRLRRAKITAKTPNEGLLAISRSWLVWCNPSYIHIYNLRDGTKQKLRHAISINSMFFDASDDSCFHTNAGTWVIDKKGFIKSTGYGFSLDGAWITKDADRLIWLPLQYRGTFAKVKENKVALGSASGSVALLQFSM